MVLQVAPDLRRIVHNQDADLGKIVGRPDAGQHKKLRRVDGTAAQDDLALGPDGLARTMPDDLDTLCPAALYDDPRGD